MISNNRLFVGRGTELHELQKLLKNPYGKTRVLLILGSGGIGKTKLVYRMLAEASVAGISAPQNPVDLFSTEHRSIDGIQLKLMEVIEQVTGLQGENSPFVEFKKEYQDTSEQFNRCLRNFCKNTPFVVAFDTIEALDSIASNWLFSDGYEGLQVPGLICVVAGRSVKRKEHDYSSLLIKELVLQGLSLQEIYEFYNKLSREFDRGPKKELKFLLNYAEIEQRKDNRLIERLFRLTKGNPLYVEMVFNWAINFTFKDKGQEEEDSFRRFQETMMQYVIEWGERGELNVGTMITDQTTFDTLVCMGVITRRFDEEILKYLIDNGFIRHEKGKDIKNIKNLLKKYFFVKIRLGDHGEQVYQLHDEMARLVQEHIWAYRDPSSLGRKSLLQAVLQYYDHWIVETNDEILKKNLQIERLYYTFQLDLFSNPIDDKGIRLWLELSDLDDSYINNYLSSEIEGVIGLYDSVVRCEIHARIAQIEFEAGHITQSRKEWELVYQLGITENQNDWIATALLGLANCEKKPNNALDILVKLKRFCEKHARDYLPRVSYSIGYIYRRLQNVEKAIEWYKKARREFLRYPKDKALGAQIVNDLGYAYSYIGEWELCQRNIDEGQVIREEIKLQLEQEVGVLEAKLKAISVKGKKVSTELQDQLARKRKQLSKARFQLGLSHNTLGEIYRYQEKLGMSLVNYRIALTQFELSKAYKWRANALFSRGETYRRIAWNKYRKGEEAGYKENTEKAEKDVRTSLYLCEKYRINEERDTANRRMGRILHDQAIRELEKGKRKDARKLLEKAREYFEEGLKYAKETNDDLEILSNQTELAFIYDDFVRAVGSNNVPMHYKNSLRDLKRMLDDHRKKPFRIYQFEVFENEYKLEEGAALYQAKKYDLALKKYIDGLGGLAVDPGYGRTRYRLLFHHLTSQIEKLSSKEAQKWCHAFIQAWETPRVIGTHKTRLDREPIFPDMLEWCWKYINKIDV